jgi:hypothetical protein
MALTDEALDWLTHGEALPLEQQLQLIARPAERLAAQWAAQHERAEPLEELVAALTAVITEMRRPRRWLFEGVYWRELGPEEAVGEGAIVRLAPTVEEAAQAV